MRKGIGSHQSHKMLKDEWLTPPWIVKELGPFDLDPCSPINRPWDTASVHLDRFDDGLSTEWDQDNRVWLNPPYGKFTITWMDKLAKHGNGIALTFARTETKMFFQTVWNKADAVLFIKGRLYFHDVYGVRAKANSGAPSVLIAYGGENADVLANANIPGAFFRITVDNG